MRLATPQELENHLQTTFTASQDADADQLLTLISAAVDRYCNLVQFTRQVDDSITLIGTFAEGISLPGGPVESVSAVTVDGTAMTNYTLLAGTYSASLFRATKTSAADDWGGSLSEVGVTYTHGFDGAPDDVKLVVLEAAAARWDTPSGVVSESIDDYEVRYQREGRDLIPPDLMGLLDDYRQTKATVPLR